MTIDGFDVSFNNGIKDCVDAMILSFYAATSSEKALPPPTQMPRTRSEWDNRNLDRQLAVLQLHVSSWGGDMQKKIERGIELLKGWKPSE